jgi:hypothetical protein
MPTMLSLDDAFRLGTLHCPREGDAVTDAVGYVASALVVLSLTMTSVVRLRWISLVGSITFVAYGVLIESVPIVITNVSIAAINVWFLRKELGYHRDLGAVVVPIDSPFLADFVHFHLADIRRFQPNFEMPHGDDAMCVLLTRDGLPAGAVIGRRRGNELEIVLDYVLRAYRDSRLGTWLFGRGSGVFRTHGVTRLVTGPGADLHPGYLQRMGFQRDGERYALDID